MPKYQVAFEAHQRARFMRPDAARWMRPDAARFIRPDAARFIRPDVARFLKPGTNPADVFPALDRKYNPSQRRLPAGQAGGGRWTDGSGSGGGSASGGATPVAAADAEAGVDLASDAASIGSDILTFADEQPSLFVEDIDWANLGTIEQRVDYDQPSAIFIADNEAPILNEFGEPYYQPGGHHEMQQSVYRKWELCRKPEEYLRIPRRECYREDWCARVQTANCAGIFGMGSIVLIEML